MHKSDETTVPMELLHLFLFYKIAEKGQSHRSQPVGHNPLKVMEITGVGVTICKSSKITALKAQ